MRRHLWTAAGLIIAAWLALILLLAHGHAPWPEERTPAQPAEAPATGDWSAITGAGLAKPEGFLIRRFDDTGAALVSWSPRPFEALRRPVLSLRLEGLPASHVVMLAWRAAGETEQRFMRLQPATGGLQTYHLARDPGWAGRVEELSLFLYPQQQAAPAIAREDSVLIADFRLRRDSLGARVQALVTGWLAPDPWEMLSISSLGALRDLHEGVRLEPVVAAAAGIAIVVIGVLFAGRDRRRWLTVGLSVLLAAVSILWAKSLSGLLAQRAATRELYAGLDQGERGLQVFDRELVLLARRAAENLPPPGRARVFVAADDRFFQLRGGWHLRPHNVMTRIPGEQIPGVDGVLAGDYLFFYRRPDLLEAARRGELRLGEARFRLEQLFIDAGGAGLLRIQGRLP